MEDREEGGERGGEGADIGLRGGGEQIYNTEKDFTKEEKVISNRGSDSSASIFSSTLAVISLLPFGYLKTQIQVMCEGKRSNLVSSRILAKKILEQRSIKAFYTGLESAAMGHITSMSTAYFLYYYLSDRAKRRSESQTLTNGDVFRSMFLARSISNFISTPFELVLLRMQADHHLPQNKQRNYTDFLSAIKKIHAEEGLSGCWRGGTAIICQKTIGFFFNMICFVMLKDNFDNSLASFAIRGGISALLTSSLVIPFDNIRIKMQFMAKNDDGKYPYQSFRDCFTKTIKREGFRGFYVGYAAFLMKTMPQAGITFTLSWIISGGK